MLSIPPGALIAMVFKLVRAGKKIAEVEKGLDGRLEMSRYLERRQRRPLHPLQEDIEILNKYIDYIRFSRHGSLLRNAPAVGEREEQQPIRGKTTLPVATISDILRRPERWSGQHVIVEGSLEWVNSSRNGEHWHRFADSTGSITAVSPKSIPHKEGTLFGIARQTSVGRQLFLEIRNFHPTKLYL